jgi:hypothetical protein
LSREKGHFTMRGSGEKNEPTKAVQKEAGVPAPVNNELETRAFGILGEFEKRAGLPRDLSARAMAHMCGSMVQPSTESDNWHERMVKGASLFNAYGPTDILETNLAIQLQATHEAAMRFLCLASGDRQSFDVAESQVNRAVRLMRLHLEQLEAWQKLKGKAGQQRVTVEHVHVHEGGRAIVGAVNAPGGGGGGE